MELVKAFTNLERKNSQATEALKEADIAAGIVGDALRHKREGKKLSLRETAKAIGISPAYLSDIERGNRWPRPIITDKLIAFIEGGRPKKKPLKP